MHIDDLFFARYTMMWETSSLSTLISHAPLIEIAELLFWLSECLVGYRVSQTSDATVA